MTTILHGKADEQARVTLPANFADSDLVIETVNDNEIRIRRVRVVTLDEQLAALVARITPENLHGEVDFGPPVGEEQI